MAYSFERYEAEIQALIDGAFAESPSALVDAKMEEVQRQFSLEPLPALRPRPTIADYDEDLALSGLHPEQDAFGHLRDLLLIGIRVGTIGVDDIYLRVRPAVMALTVLLDPGAGPIAPELADRIRRDAGLDVSSWSNAVVVADSWSGSLHNLLRRDPADPLDSRLATVVITGLAEHLWRGSNILLALAPSETLARMVADAAPMPVTGSIVGRPEAVRFARALLRIVSHAPLTRAVVDHVLTPDASARLRLHLAANPLASDATLRRLLTFADREFGIAAAICMNESAPREMRLATYRRVHASDVWGWVRLCLAPDMRIALEIETTAAATPEEAPMLHALIQRNDSDLSPEARLFVYAQLARLSGPEAVWDLELELAGSPEAMNPVVRASMESESLTPLLEAAVATPYRGLRDVPVSGVGLLRREELLDRPFPWLERQPRRQTADTAEDL